MRVWDARTGRRLCILRTGGREVLCTRFLPAGDALVVDIGHTEVWVRRRPERWWGHLHRPEVWAAIVVGALWLWRLVALRREMRRTLRGAA